MPHCHPSNNHNATTNDNNYNHNNICTRRSLGLRISFQICYFHPFPECADKDTIPVLRVIEKLKKVKTVEDCSKKCNQNSDCDYYKWKVTQTQSKFIMWSQGWYLKILTF